jgi:hypothetical protein
VPVAPAISSRGLRGVNPGRFAACNT